MKRIFIAGHRGLVGSALVRRFTDWDVVTSGIDLCDAEFATDTIGRLKPDAIICAAGKVGGIAANSRNPVEFFCRNMAIQMNVLEAAHLAKTAKVMMLGSSCIYPRDCPQPMEPEHLLSGSLEPTNEAYALAKIGGLKLASFYRKQYGMNAICVMPTNLYGPGDNFDREASHVIPGMIRRFHEAKVVNAESVTLWGDGTPRREFLHVDDLADACHLLMDRYNEADIVNIGYGHDVEICLLANEIAAVVGFTGRIDWDASKPNGTPCKLLCTAPLFSMDWMPKIDLHSGIRSTYEWILNNSNNLRGWKDFV